MNSTQRTLWAAISVAVVTGAGVLFGQPIAAAHVSAESDQAEAGERATVSFRVPNESETASTVGIKVVFPDEHPLAQVTPQALAGWTVTVTKKKLAAPVDNHGEAVTEAVSSIVWSGGKIPPGQFQAFTVRIGPLPDEEDELVFKTVQTYSDGKVVRWIDEQEPGQPEPEHPAPTLAVTPHDEHTTAQAEEDGDLLARALGGGGLTAGLAALGLALVARSRGGLSSS